MVEYVDISKQRARNKFLLRVAKRLFHDAYAVTCLYDVDDGTSQVIDGYGRIIAVAWIDPFDGKPEFKPVVPDSELN